MIDLIFFVPTVPLPSFTSQDDRIEAAYYHMCEKRNTKADYRVRVASRINIYFASTD